MHRSDVRDLPMEPAMMVMDELEIERINMILLLQQLEANDLMGSKES